MRECLGKGALDGTKYPSGHTSGRTIPQDGLVQWGRSLVTGNIACMCSDLETVSVTATFNVPVTKELRASVRWQCYRVTNVTGIFGSLLQGR